MRQIELIADYACLTGENPLWHPMEKRLYWLDIPRGRMFRYDPATGKHEQCHQGEQVGGFTVQADGGLLMFGTHGSIRVWREGIVRTIVEEIPEELESRFNDVIADPSGRVFCGTMPKPDGSPGSLYRLDRDGTLTRLFGGIGCSNGMGFTPDRKRMYHTDSKPREVYTFAYDERTGSLADRRLFLRLPEGSTPDGMTVDAEGFVWCAIWGGSCVIRFSPEGWEMERIELPARLCASLTFAGPDLSDLYVTCAGGDDRQTNGPGAGGLYRVRGTGHRGAPEFVSRVML
ncbi:MAG: SMP-30/gluconolactonase/LRE family protein [Spirochaetes bacterium]|nr:SMP-30/gluconolactonase/LRE family protein [Spirochaetota bacterium]